MSEKLPDTALAQKIEALEKEVSSGKRAIEALKQSEKSYAYLVENATDIVYKINLKGYFLFFNPVAVRVTGFSEKELYAMHYLDLIRNDYREKSDELYASQYLNKIESTYHEFPLISKGGKEIWLGQNVQLIGEGDRIVGFHAISRDISKQKLSEEALKRSKEELSTKVRDREEALQKANDELKKEIEQRKVSETKLKQVLKDLGFLSETTTAFLVLSPDEDIYEMIGERLRQMVSRSIVIVNAYEPQSNLFHIKSIKGLGKYANRILRMLGKNPVGMTTELNDELARQRLTTGRLVSGPQGLHELSFGAIPQGIARAVEKLLGVGNIYVVGFSQRGELYGSAIIITRQGKDESDLMQKREVIETFIDQAAVALQRNRMEEVLRESEKRYRLLAENASDIIWTVDLDTMRYTYVSPSVFGISGLTSEQTMDQSVDKVISSENLERMMEELAMELARDGQAGLDPKRSKTMAFQQRNKDGSHTWAEATMTFIRDDQGRPVEILGVTRDISERMRTEEEKKALGAKLQQSQRLEAVATLAGGIAHQFNNALSAIVGRLELLELDASGQETVGRLAPIKETAHRMGKLTSQLLAYARGGKYQARTISISQFVRETLPLTQHTLRPSVHVETDLPLNIPPVKADVTQMQTVLSALLSNASEAIEDVGRIRISCGEVRFDEDAVADMPGLKPGPYVKLTVRDDGKGMDEGVKGRIFEPFFTTQFQGRGLGMAAAYGIIRNHNGWISVESEPDRGTSVHVYLLVTAEKTVEKKTKRAETTASLKDAGTVLLIEDDEMVLDISRAMLEKLGYDVIVAGTGREGVKACTGFQGHMDLALLDLKLPDMEAKHVYAELKASRPDMKVIVYSGYSLEGPAQEILDAGADAFIQKPFSMDVLSDTIHTILKS